MISPADAVARIATYETLSVSERKILQIRNPAASALTFLTVIKSIFTHLYQFPLDHHGAAKDSKIMRAPWRQRRAGIMGAICAALLLAHELSKSQNNHTHVIIFTPMDYRYMHTLVTKPAENEAFGKFMNAIVATEYHQPAWEAYDAIAILTKPTKTFQPTPLLWSSRPLPSQCLTWDSSFFPTDVDPVFHFDTPTAAQTLIIINHYPHNLACFPVPERGQTQKTTHSFWNTPCRFGLKSQAWNQQSALVQVELLEDRKSIGILKTAKPFETNSFLYVDHRAVILAFSRRTSDTVDMRSVQTNVLNLNIIHRKKRKWHRLT